MRLRNSLDISIRAILLLKNYIQHDRLLAEHFKPDREVMRSLALGNYFKEVSDNGGRNGPD